MIEPEYLADLVHTSWRAGELPAFTPSDDWDHRLPDAPRPDWAAPFLFATPLVRNPEPFLQAIQDANLPLAGECAALIKDRKREDGVGRRRRVRTSELAACSPEYLDALRSALVARSRDREADLRARIAAGRALGELGDPRYTRGVSAEGHVYLLPPLVAIPAGHYRLGSDDHHDDEKQARTEWLDGFQISRFPVTNAEWRCFMEAGGYADERWWKGNEARRWWESRDTDAPLCGSNPAFDALSQPVVGITFYEARAYCAWLFAVSERRFGLPTEQQWTSALGVWNGGRTRGATRSHPTGPWYLGLGPPTRPPTPIGVFRDGETPASDEQGAVVDLASQMLEWTESTYTPGGYQAHRPPGGEVARDWRVVRSGSMAKHRGLGLASSGAAQIGGFALFVGCRLCASLPSAADP